VLPVEIQHPQTGENQATAKQDERATWNIRGSPDWQKAKSSSLLSLSDPKGSIMQGQ
jgi:hypothetical protein